MINDSDTVNGIPCIIIFVMQVNEVVGGTSYYLFIIYIQLSISRTKLLRKKCGPQKSSAFPKMAPPENYGTPLVSVCSPPGDGVSYQVPSFHLLFHGYFTIFPPGDPVSFFRPLSGVVLRSAPGHIRHISPNHLRLYPCGQGCRCGRNRNYISSNFDSC